jgi:hypothetical protein
MARRHHGSLGLQCISPRSLPSDKYVPASRALRDILGVASCGPPHPRRKTEPHLAAHYALLLVSYPILSNGMEWNVM